MHLGDQIDFGRETSEGFSNIIHEVESTLSLFGLNNAEKYQTRICKFSKSNSVCIDCESL